MADEIISRAEARAQGLKRYLRGFHARWARRRAVREDGKCVRCVSQYAATVASCGMLQTQISVKRLHRSRRDANPDNGRPATKPAK